MTSGKGRGMRAAAWMVACGIMVVASWGQWTKAEGEAKTSPFKADLSRVTPATRVPLGVNVEGVRDWARSRTFVDAIKSARKFGTASAPWDSKAELGPDGWPIGDFGIVVIADVPNSGGTYKLSFDGKADVGLNASPGKIENKVYDPATNKTTADVVVDKSATQVFLGFSKAEKVKNVRLIRPGEDPKSNKVFTQELIDALQPFTTIRTMDFTQTNNNTVEKWDQRTKETDPIQASEKGACWEYAIELANQAGKDLWVNVPDMVDDAYVAELAKLLKARLKPELNIYVEYSNEVWNWSFKQTDRNQKAARLEVAEDEEAGRKQFLMDGDKDKNEYYLGIRRVSKRIVEISNMFRKEFGDSAMMTRVRPVLASQISNPFMLRLQLEFMDRNYGRPSKFIYAVAGAPYFNLPDIVNLKRDRTVDHIIEALGKTVDKFRSIYDTYTVLALHYGVKNICYEGGVDVQGEESLKAKLDAQSDPRMQELVARFLTDWYAAGGDLMCYYALCGSYTKFGAWGLTDDLSKETPKTKAVVQVVSKPRPEVNRGVTLPGVINAYEATIKDGGNIMNLPGGGKFLGTLGAGNAFYYLTRATESGKYALTLEAAGAGKGKVEVSVDGKVIGEVTAPATKDWDTYESAVPVEMDLTPGQHSLRIRVTTPGLNLKSIKIERSGKQAASQ